MADNYLERKFEEYYSGISSSTRKCNRRPFTKRQIIVFGLNNEISDTIIHSLSMLGHKAWSTDNLNITKNIDAIIIDVNSTEKNADRIQTLLKNPKYHRCIVVGQDIDFVNITDSLKTLFIDDVYTINCVNITPTATNENIARACRIFIADENVFLTNNTLTINK